MLLIHGSNRKNKTSYQFAKAFESVSRQRCDILWVHDYLGKIHELLEVIDKHSVIGLIVPLYVDTLPAAVIEILEDLSPYKERLSGKRLFSLAQSGFPDETRMTPLSLTCKCFAEEMGLQWLGALVHGGGVIIDGRPISDLGKKGARLMEGIKYVLEAIESGGVIPKEAQGYFSSRIPSFTFPLLAWYLNTSAKKESKRNGVDLYDQYYINRR
jgi:hypothetical protein